MICHLSFGHLSFTNWALVISLILAAIDWLAVARRQKRLEYVFKPATLVAIIIAVIETYGRRYELHPDLDERI